MAYDLLLFLFGLSLMSIIHAVCSGEEEDLLRSIELATACPTDSDSSQPVLALSPKRFTQAIALIKKKNGVETCGGLKKETPFLLYNSKTWPFCVMGDCEAGKCKCFPFYSGEVCEIFSKVCWIMYCYVNCCRCSSSLRNLHCKCNPLLYGSAVSTGIYWFDDGKVNNYKPPPRGWKDTQLSKAGVMLHVQSGKVQQAGSRKNHKNKKLNNANTQAKLSEMNQQGLTNGQGEQISASKSNQPGDISSKNDQSGQSFNSKNGQLKQSSNQKISNMDKSKGGIQNGLNPLAFPSAGLKNVELENKESSVVAGEGGDTPLNSKNNKKGDETVDELKAIEDEEKETSSTAIKISTKNTKYLSLWMTINLLNYLIYLL